MKPFFIFLSAFLFFNFEKKPAIINLTATSVIASSVTDDSSIVRFTNNSSLKRLPSILRDLSIALNESAFQWDGIINRNGFAINLHDAMYKNFDTSAIVSYRPGDTIYYLTLNRFNKNASDRALAVTIIHEFMHCVLMEIDKRARHGDEKSLFIVERFNQQIKGGFRFPDNNFFGLMNKENCGQHELMYQLFFHDMVLLLERFAQIHKPSFKQHEEAETLMWSGLQMTTEYQKLSFEEKRQIEYSILKEKGVPVSLLDY